MRSCQVLRMRTWKNSIPPSFFVPLSDVDRSLGRAKKRNFQKIQNFPSWRQVHLIPPTQMVLRRVSVRALVSDACDVTMQQLVTSHSQNVSSFFLHFDHQLTFQRGRVNISSLSVWFTFITCFYFCWRRRMVRLKSSKILSRVWQVTNFVYTPPTFVVFFAMAQYTIVGR